MLSLLPLFFSSCSSLRLILYTQTESVPRQSRQPYVQGHSVMGGFTLTLTWQQTWEKIAMGCWWRPLTTLVLLSWKQESIGRLCSRSKPTCYNDTLSLYHPHNTYFMSFICATLARASFSLPQRQSQLLKGFMVSLFVAN